MKGHFKKLILWLLITTLALSSVNFAFANDGVENEYAQQDDYNLKDEVASGSAVDEDIMPMSMLPLEEVEATLVLSGYTVNQLKTISVQTVIDKIQTSDGKYLSGDLTVDSQIVIREIKNNAGETIVDEYRELSLNDEIDLSIFSNTVGYTFDMIVGSGNQLDYSNKRYIVKVYATDDFDDVLDFEVYMQDENGNREKVDYTMQISMQEKEFADGITQNVPLYTLRSTKNIDTRDKKMYVSIKSLKEQHPDISVGAYVYDSFGYYDINNAYNDVLFNQEMTQKDAGFKMSRMFLPYSLDMGLFYNKATNSNTDWNGYKRETLDEKIINGAYTFSEDYYLFSLDIIPSSTSGLKEKPAQIGLYDENGNWVDVDESYNYNMNIYKDKDSKLDVDRIITYYLDSNNEENTEYYLRFNENSIVLSKDESIDKIVLGKYTKSDDVSQLEDIKDQVCGKGYRAKYNGDGIQLTVLLSAGTKKILFSYVFKVINKVPDFTSLPIIGKADPYFRLTGVNGANSYVIENGGVYNLDTYYGYGYQTVLVDDPNADFENLKPEFWFAADDYFNLYKVDKDRSELETTDNPSSITKKNQQYALAWKNDTTGTKVRNYWLSVVKKTNDGPKLFVDGPDSGETREVLLTDYFENKHDVFVANTGNEPLYISAELSDDAENVKLDDYWTVGGENNQKLKAFTVTETPSDYSELPNVAKVRLLRPDTVVGDGSVSGKLVIKASGGLVNGELDKNNKYYEEYIIYLNDNANNPRFVTEELKPSVKFVPYQSILATDNKFENNIVTYKIIKGELPKGVTFNESTGEIYGVPLSNAVEGYPLKYPITVRADFSDKQFKSVTTDLEFVLKNNTDANVYNETDFSDGFGITAWPEMVYLSPNEETLNRVFEFDYDYGEHKNEFQGFWLDGTKLKEGEDYIVELGSTKITIQGQTFRNAGNGTHTIAAEYRNGDNKVKKAAKNYKAQMGSDSAYMTARDQTKGADVTNRVIKPDNPTKPDPTPTPSPAPSPTPSRRSGGGGGTPRYTISYESNGGSVVKSQSVMGGNKITFLATPEKKGYVFAGWYTDKELKNKFDQSKGITADIKLYAKYEKADYTIWFNSEGGSNVSSIKIKGDTAIEKLPEASKDGYAFKGWYTEAGKPFQNGSKVYENMTLYAKWELIIPEEAPENAAGFYDVVESDWYYNDVNWAYENNLMVGYNNAIFAPNDKITTSNIVAILARLSQDDLSIYQNSTAVNGIEENRWYTSSAKWAIDKGIIKTFDANKAVSREDIALILMNYINYKGIEYIVPENYVKFNDADLVDSSAVPVLQTLYSMGIIFGRPNDIIDPKGITTRGEFAAFIHRMSDKTNN